MIIKLIGVVDFIYDDQISINVSGVCYGVSIGRNIANHYSTGDKISLLIQQIVKEDGVTLYGFVTLEEKLWFNELIKINGISGRIAIAIVGNLSPEDLCDGIMAGDERMFASLSGIGKKLAARITTEMTDVPAKIKNQLFKMNPSGSGSGVAIEAREIVNNSPERSTDRPSLDKKSRSILAESIATLQQLGFGRAEAKEAAIIALQEENNNSLELAIKAALKHLGNNK